MKEVSSGTLEVDYVITEHIMSEGPPLYDWTLSNGHTSEELFLTADDATDDLMRRY